MREDCDADEGHARDGATSGSDVTADFPTEDGLTAGDERPAKKRAREAVRVIDAGERSADGVGDADGDGGKSTAPGRRAAAKPSARVGYQGAAQKPKAPGSAAAKQPSVAVGFQGPAKEATTGAQAATPAGRAAERVALKRTKAIFVDGAREAPLDERSGPRPTPPAVDDAPPRDAPAASTGVQPAEASPPAGKASPPAGKASPPAGKASPPAGKASPPAGKVARPRPRARPKSAGDQRRAKPVAPGAGVPSPADGAGPAKASDEPVPPPATSRERTSSSPAKPVGRPSPSRARSGDRTSTSPAKPGDRPSPSRAAAAKRPGSDGAAEPAAGGGAQRPPSGAAPRSGASGGAAKRATSPGKRATPRPGAGTKPAGARARAIPAARRSDPPVAADPDAAIGAPASRDSPSADLDEGGVAPDATGESRAVDTAGALTVTDGEDAVAPLDDHPAPGARTVTDGEDAVAPLDDEIGRGAPSFEDDDDDRFAGLDLDLEAPDDRRRKSRRARRRERRERGGRPARHEVSAERRAELVAAAAKIAAGEPIPVSKTARRGDRSRTFNRVAVLVALAALAVAVAALVEASDPVTPLSPSDADFMSAQLVAVDRRVRGSLEHLRELGPAPAIDHARNAVATTRSLVIELRNSHGDVADRLRRALTLEGAWLDAIGSTLANPRSPLQAQLAARDDALRPALAALPGRGAPHANTAPLLVSYSRSRIAGNS
jgi:hypothetical protein